MIANLKEVIEKALATDPTLESAWTSLRQYKEQGVTKSEMLSLLEEMRGEADEAREDLILELMDFVAGFCSPHARIWDE